MAASGANDVLENSTRLQGTDLFRGTDPFRRGIVSRIGFALYSIPMEPDKLPSKPADDEIVSRRAFGGKLVYLPPTVLAVIKATERPALAQSPN